MPNAVHIVAVPHDADGLLPVRTALPADRVGNDALIRELGQPAGA